MVRTCTRCFLLGAMRSVAVIGRGTGGYFVFQVASKGVTTIWAVREKQTFFQRVNHQPAQLTTGPMSTYAPVPSLDGKRLFVGGRQSRIDLVRYDVKTKDFIPFLAGISAEGLDFSRDGKWVTYVAYPEQTLWRSMVNGEQRLQLSSSPLRASLPRWSPDRTEIAFMGYYPGQSERVFLVRADGGRIQQLTNAKNNSDPTWSSDGKMLALSGYPLNERQASHEISVQILNLTKNDVSTLPGSEGLWSPRWSPDGHYIVALSTDTQTLLLFDFRSQKWAELAKANFGYPSWSRNSEYIYFDTLGVDAAFSRVRVSDRKVERIVDLKDVQRQVGAFGPWTRLAPDDSPLVARDAGFDEIYALDWNAP
jgi:Tol biopolymer transport system component